MQNAQRKALETYKENLAYLAQNHQILHEKLILLDTAIFNEIYVERYILEYKNEGYFDVLEVESGDYLYGENSIYLAQNIVDSMDFSRTNGVFEAQRFVDFSPEMADIIDQSKLHFHNALWASIKLIEYSKKVAPRETTQMKVVYKLLFLGIGLGLHISGIVKKMGGKIIFLQEHNLELFRLSLFVSNYARLAKHVNLFFSIMENEEKTRETFNLFLETGNNYNLYLKQISLTQDYQEDLFRYQDYVMRQEHIVYPYSAYLLRYIDSPQYIAQGRPFINISKMLSAPIWEDKPVLFLFSGPSTAKNIEWVKENQHRFLIVSALSTCRFLYKQGVKPDIAIHIDPEEKGTLMLLEGIPMDYFDDILCIMASNAHPNIVSLFNPDKLYFIEQATHYKKGFGSFSSPTVGEYTYAIFLIFGAKQLYLLGIDLALDPDTLLSHVPDHPFASTSGDTSEELDKTLIEISGNFLPMVPTHPMYRLSIEQFGRMSSMFKSTQMVYNLSNGALLDGATPKHIEELDMNDFSVMDRTKIHREMKEFFENLSSCEFREEDKEVIRIQLKEAKKLKAVIEQFKKSTFVMPTIYITALAKLNHQLSDMENKTSSNLAEVYYLYFKVVLSYICEILNTRELTDIKVHIGSINTILVTQLEKIANTFIEAMEGYLSEEAK
ncbi:MAG: DUF115 domain-containing protein [Sulfuricurvum sp.]|nr:DUF115 domain-containing protein [Sulfuricurvum sp.]